MKINLDKNYTPKEIESILYQNWLTKGYFKPTGDTGTPSYSIAIPPPNVTGYLHMGHAFQQTIMDALIRYHRMQGDNTLWQVGTDHAGIATQMVVERKIMAESQKSRHDYGRDAFIEKIREWKEKSGGVITEQMKRLGNSVDWDRERFTMDTNLVKAVKEVFIRLYEDGLIYRGKRLVNWDPKLLTAISDLEVENREKKGTMWYLRYPLADGYKTVAGKDYLIVATTRPETLLGDTAVAVNPKDPRYADLIGKEVILPFVNRCIPIIGDEHADMEKGTGCVKITPGHDFNDYEVGQRHALPMINIFTLDGKIRQQAEVLDTTGQPGCRYSTELPGKFIHLDRVDARKAIIRACEAQGILEKAESHNLTLPYGDRSGVIIEPLLTDQWYVRAKELARPAIAAVKNGDIKFVSKQYENMYFAWMNDIQDWCISRQLWWGHRIPAWYDDKGNIYVAGSEQEVRDKYHLLPNVVLRQDEDVLDTWFSSALWTFSTLGWPEDSADLAMYHPTSVLITGFDIIFFWVARMIMMSLYFVKDKTGKPQIPFKEVYITGLIRDEDGQKMSKSKGNVIDPIDMIDGISLEALVEKRTNNMMQSQLADKIRKRTEKAFPTGIPAYGTDALRFTLMALTTTGRDINWDMKRLEGYRNFCNKLWNASRYVLMQIDTPINEKQQHCAYYSLADKWILTEFNQTVTAYRAAFDSYRFDMAASVLYDFTWNHFCDWYLELTKPILTREDKALQAGARETLLRVLESLLRLAHPIMPFITEKIWQSVKVLLGLKGDSIMLEPFPSPHPEWEDKKAYKDMQWIKEVITAIRVLRANMGICTSTQVPLLVKGASAATKARIQAHQSFICSLAKIENIAFLEQTDILPLAATKLVTGVELLIPLAGLIDKDAELKRLEKELTRLAVEIKRLQEKLGNANFTQRAPAAVVAKEKEKLVYYQLDKETLTEYYHKIEQLGKTDCC